VRLTSSEAHAGLIHVAGRDRLRVDRGAWIGPSSSMPPIPPQWRAELVAFV